jgi:tagaturonate reductase
MTEGASPIHLLPSFGHSVLSKEDAEHYRRTQGLPVKVLQFAEGNFLRGFADWMLDRCNRQALFNGSVAVTQPRPSGKNNLDKFRKQDGLYTLLIRGLKEGVQVEEKETVAVVTRTVDPYEEWDQFVALADHPNLEWILSNTTEAGLCYTPVPGRRMSRSFLFRPSLPSFCTAGSSAFRATPPKG